MAALLLAVLVIVLFWPAFFQGQVFTADASLYSLAPWNALTPAALGHWDNTILIDIPRANYTWDVFDRHAIQHLEFPAWTNAVL
ncbi:MAG: hypothetical protein ACYCST_21020, partial [Acidimicrobiales bacterium]